MVENSDPLAANGLSFFEPLVQVRVEGVEAVVCKETHEGSFWLHYTHGRGTSMARVRSSRACEFVSIQGDAHFYLAGHMPHYAEAVEVIVGDSSQTHVVSGHGLWCTIGPVSEQAIVRFSDKAGNSVKEVHHIFGSWPLTFHVSWVQRLFNRFFGLPKRLHTFVGKDSVPTRKWWRRLIGDRS